MRRAAAAVLATGALGAALLGARLAGSAGGTAAQDRGSVRPIVVTASRYKFDPPLIEVFQDDLVKIQLQTADIAHSWTVDAYRIAKRVGPGQPVTFEFRADAVGTFPVYCNLQIDDGCRRMRGQLVVKARR